MAYTTDMGTGKVTGSIAERKLAEAKSMFETEPQKKKRKFEKFKENADKVLRPKKV